MFSVKNLVLAGTAMAAALSASSASAATLLFELTGSRTATFTINTSVAPDYMSSSTLIGNQIGYNNVAGTFGGMATTASINFGTYLVSSFEISGVPALGFSQFAGPDLFTGLPSAPVFNLGTFNLSSIVSGNSTLHISDISPMGGVPEPSTWILMFAGIAGTGMAFRRRRRVEALSLLQA